MLVLIDYDNVPMVDRKFGVDHVVRKLFSAMPKISPIAARYRVRLYGGWYEGGRLTRVGQEIGAEIRGCSPVPVANAETAVPIFADVELVFSSLIHPRTLVDNTYREQSNREGLRCRSRPWFNCADSEKCIVSSVHDFLNDNSCSHKGCSLRPADILYRMEQKVVDTLMVADMASARLCGYQDICVVSRDDDIWPGLCLAAQFAKNVVHVSTAKSSRLPKYFAAIPSPPYQFAMWS